MLYIHIYNIYIYIYMIHICMTCMYSLCHYGAMTLI